jgi:flagellar hook assembly protein FlgD
VGAGGPNPFSARTEIAFELAEAAHTTLTVYDVMGRKVATLVDRPMPSGPHAVAWNGHSDQGSKLASGVYFYRLSAGDVSQTKRLVIVR